MKRFVLLSIVLLTSISVPVLTAQEKKPATEKEKAAKKINYFPVYLGNSNYQDGNITKTVFDSLMRQGLTTRDSAGNAGKVESFLFMYKERNLYEDSVGNLMISVDVSSEVCPGNKLTDIISGSIYDRTKRGDTLQFDDITLTAPDNSRRQGRPMRFVIVK